MNTQQQKLFKITLIFFAIFFLISCGFEQEPIIIYKHNKNQTTEIQKTEGITFPDDSGIAIVFQEKTVYRWTFETNQCIHAIVESLYGEATFNNEYTGISIKEAYFENGKFDLEINSQTPTSVIIGFWPSDNCAKHHIEENYSTSVNYLISSGWILAKIYSWMLKNTAKRFLSWFDYCSKLKSYMESQGYICPWEYDDPIFCPAFYIATCAEQAS